MLEPPSEELLRRLQSANLCKPSDLRRARRIVKRLARDLPAFDSVWIDALVQLRVITPHQARVLESEAPSELLIGDYLLLDEIGRSTRSTTWLARNRHDRTHAVLKRVDSSSENRQRLVSAARDLATLTGDFAHPQLVAPFHCWELDGGVAFLSRWIQGVPLGELLVRRGRFPSRIVAELGKQLTEGLAAWHARGGIHGDIRLSHVRIDPTGRAILVEAGLRPVIEPEITLHAPLALDAYDGIAPELIGIGKTPTPAADWYGLGCLLWQLLAGRPPFAVADPLAKLAAHQTRTIEDVREWAPEAPAALAELIQNLTQRDPARRPRDAGGILTTLQRFPTVGRQGLLRFRQRFNPAVPHLQQISAHRSVGWPVAATTGVLALAGVVWLSDAGRRGELLSIADGWLGLPVPSSAPAEVVPPDPRGGLLPLPAPGADGVIVLAEAGPYAVDVIQHTGPLQLIGAPNVCPEILVRDEPLRLTSETLRIQNVHFRRDTAWPTSRPLKSLVVAQAQQIEIHDATWDLGDPPPRRRNEAPPFGIAWRVIEPLDVAAGQMRLRNTVFRGVGTAIYASDAARKIDVQNSLRIGGTAWFGLRMSSGQPPVHVTLANSTVRDCDALLRCQPDPASPTDLPLRVTTVDCVLAVSTKSGALLQVLSEAEPVLSPTDLVWSGESTLIPDGIPLVTWQPQSPTAEHPGGVVDTDAWVMDGLVLGRWTFSGLPTASARDSALIDTDIPRRSSTFPGVIAERFQSCQGGTVPEFAEGPLRLETLE